MIENNSEQFFDICYKQSKNQTVKYEGINVEIFMKFLSDLSKNREIHQNYSYAVGFSDDLDVIIYNFRKRDDDCKAKIEEFKKTSLATTGFDYKTLYSDPVFSESKVGGAAVSEIVGAEPIDEIGAEFAETTDPKLMEESITLFKYMSDDFKYTKLPNHIKNIINEMREQNTQTLSFIKRNREISKLAQTSSNFEKEINNPVIFEYKNDIEGFMNESKFGEFEEIPNKSVENSQRHVLKKGELLEKYMNMESSLDSNRRFITKMSDAQLAFYSFLHNTASGKVEKDNSQSVVSDVKSE
jgi:hypothetical protein